MSSVTVKSCVGYYLCLALMLIYCARDEKDNEVAMCRDDTMNLRGKGSDVGGGQNEGEGEGERHRTQESS